MKLYNPFHALSLNKEIKKKKKSEAKSMYFDYRLYIYVIYNILKFEKNKLKDWCRNVIYLIKKHILRKLC